MTTIPFAERSLFLQRVKRIGTLRLLLLFMIVFLPGRLHALDFTYTTNSGTVTITGYTGSGKAVIIPAIIDGLPVVGIGNSAFSNKTSITSVTIPNSVTSIGGGTFASCSGLTSINIPASVSYIGWYAFTNCTAMKAISVASGNLNYCSVDGILYDKSRGELIVCPAGKVGSVNIPSSVTHIRICALENSAGLTSVTIPTSVTYIDTRAFENCTGLTTVTIPASVTYMGNDTFTGCTGLTSVSIAAKLGRYAFSGCSNLTTVSILAGATGISKSEFPGCSKLSAFTAATSSAVYSSLNGVLFNKDKTTLILFPIGKTGAYAIPVGVTSIGDEAFSDCVGLTSVTIPSSVTSIESYAFSSCSGLTSVTIPNSVTGIGSYAFYFCRGLESVTIPSSVTSIGQCAFLFCRGLTSVTIPNSVTSIGNFVFSDCEGLTSITIPTSVTSIGSNAFSQCSGLTSVTIPNSVTSIGDSAFSYCTRLTSVTIPNSVTSIGDSAFSGCGGLTSVTIPNSVTSIGASAFSLCEGLTSLTIPNSVTNIGDSAFSSCYGLTSVTIPSSVTTIGSHAFADCRGITSVNIPAGISSIGRYAFSGCTSLISVSIPSGVISIGEYAFSSTRMTNVIIPGSVTNIGDYAFYPCSGLANATFLGNAPTMGAGVFYGAASGFTVYYYSGGSGFTSPTWKGYTAVAMPSGPNIVVEQPAGMRLTDGGVTEFGVVNVGEEGVMVFTVRNMGNLDLTSLAISKDGPNTSVFTVGSLGASSLTAGSSTTFTVTFAPGLEGTKTAAIHIASNDTNENPFDINLTGATPLAYTSNGASITITGYKGSGGVVAIPDSIDGLPVVSIGDSAFRNKPGLTSVTIPNSVTSIGYCAFYGCSGLTSVTIPNSVASIGGSAFGGCSSLTSVTIPASVTSIGPGTFLNCSGLTSVTIPSSVTGIGSNAFKSCSALTSVTIPNSVTSIGNGAFVSCRGLTSVTIPNSVTSIGEGVFGSCSGLTSVTIPNSVTSIGNGAFGECSGLTSVTIPNSVTSIEAYAFGFCNKLTHISVDSLNPNYSSLNGVLFSKNQSLLMQCQGGKTGTYVVPSSVTTIEAFAFGWCESLTSVTIPASVTSIGNGAFSYCDVLKSAIFLGNAPTIQDDVFYGAAAGFTVYFDPSKTGFTTPTWQGYATAALSTSGEIVVIGPGGASIADGGAALGFGGVYPGGFSRSVFTIRNIGAKSLAGLTITKNGANVADFAVSTLTTTILTSGAETTFTVSFSPTAAGSRTAVIHIASNDADENPFDIALSGTGIGTPEIVVQQPAGTNLKDGISSKSFGSVVLKSSITKTFTIKNTGTANLTGLAITKTGANSKEFTVKAPLKTSLAPGASTTFKVIFKPSAKGTRKAFIHIKSNDSNENPFDIALTGKGTAKSAAPSALAKSDRVLSQSDHGVRRSIGTVRLSDGRKYLTLTVVKSPDLLYEPVVEVSPNLVDWFSGRKHATIITDDASLLKVRDNTPLRPGTKRYIRIKTTGLR